jgi:hypothetical protein
MLSQKRLGAILRKNKWVKTRPGVGRVVWQKPE